MKAPPETADYADSADMNMKKWIITVLAIIGFLAAAPASGLRDRDGDGVALIIDLSRQPPQNPFYEEYEKMLWPTVRIRAGNSTGSGVIFETTDEHGLTQVYILSAAHVVGNNSTVTIELFSPITDGLSVLCGSVAITDTAKDLALIRIRPDLLPPQIYSATLAPKSYQPYLFRHIYTIGCSLGLPPRPSEGIISVIEDTYWEVTSPILPGNSGGPVYDARTYEIIGIAVWVKVYKGQLITTMAGIVPIQTIYKFMKPQIDTDKH